MAQNGADSSVLTPDQVEVFARWGADVGDVLFKARDIVADVFVVERMPYQP